MSFARRTAAGMPMTEPTGGTGPDQREDYAKDAAKEGRAAARAGLTGAHNPYPFGTHENYCWWVGWRAETADEEIGITKACDR